MRNGGTMLTLAPFVIVIALALGIALAGYVTGPRMVSAPSRSASPTPTSTAASPTAPRSASPSTSPSATPGSNEALEMLRVHNELRAAVSAPPLRTDERVIAAAQRHAEYLARNQAGGHEETPGQPGFTGTSVHDRLAAQGFADAMASEVAVSFGSGTDGVRSLWVLPYHRLGLMHPHAVVAGWGHAEIAGRTETVGVLVYDFGSSGPDRVRSPAPGQHVSGSWSGEESPDVLPSGAGRPVGYPIMVLFSDAPVVDLISAKVTDASGSEVANYVVPQIYERDYVAIVPSRPLTPGSRYRVRLELNVAGAPVVDEWEFEADR
jgi:uncharacterized protein YkwD